MIHARHGFWLGLVLASTSVVAQTGSIEEVVIFAHPLSEGGLSQAADVLEGTALSRKLAASIGETLARQPGIHSAQFASAVGRPVINGLSGPRIKVMEDRIDTLDVSVSSGDHAVAVEPFIVERIEVLKGSSTLLYGSGAIGGVVDVHTARIPNKVPDKTTGGIELRYNDNGSGKTAATKVNGGGGNVAWHIDAVTRESGDYDIPGSTVSRRQSEIDGEPGVVGKLPGSDFDFQSAAVGASLIRDWGFAGFSTGQIDAVYGLPGDPDEIPTLDLKRQRNDFEMGITQPFWWFDSLNLRVGMVDYEHREIEPNGEVATTFANDAWEARSELVYKNSTGQGALGLQLSRKEFSAIGEESFIPPVDTMDTGIFWIGKRSIDSLVLDLGVRLDRVEHDPSLGKNEVFYTNAVSGGAVIELATAWQLGMHVDVSSRAPVAEELYSDGPHLVTGTFERGNSALDSERAGNISATIHFNQGEVWNTTATFFYTRFSDFIYQQATGATEDGLPVVAYVQEDARYFGLDFEFSARVASWDRGSASINGMFDFVDAEIDAAGNSNIPRTPPMRYGLGIEASWGRVNASVNYIRAGKQDDIAPLELESDSYEDLGFYVGYTLPFGGTTLESFIQGKNLTDDEQRLHTSFIKEVAPAPGRSVETGIRIAF
ncbi:MAG: TonB-dependent receptor [Pseudomonadales bacterium]